MATTHTHGGISHTHSSPAADSTSSRLALALFVTLAFVVIEGAAGYLANSLALITDAAHNLTDVGALALSWYAMRLVARPANHEKTFGYHRAGILAALLNSTALLVFSFFIIYEAFQRLRTPEPVQANILIIVALVALIVNAGTALLLRRGSEHDLNQRSAFVHLAADAVATLGALLAGIGIALTGWLWLDPLVSILIALLIVWSAWGILRETIDILLEGTPRDVDLDAMVRDMQSIQGVRSVHDLHVWSLSKNLRALSAHVLTDDMPISRGADVQRSVNDMLVRKYSIGHSALQLETVGCEPDTLFCELNPAENSPVEIKQA